MSQGGQTFEIQEDQLNSSKIKYLDITNKLNDYNEIYNLNQHLLVSNTQELDKISAVNDQIRTKIMKMKQNYLLTDYGINEYSLYNNLVSFTIIVACLTIYIVAKTDNADKKKLIWICVVIGVLYLIIVMITLASNKNRRKYAWNQMYWSPVEKKN